MNKILLSIIVLCCTASCIGAPSSSRSATKSGVVVTIAEPTHYSYIVKNVYPHSTTSYTQGLQYIDSQLWESTGLNGESRIMKVDLQSGNSELFASLSASEFGEGMTILRDTLYQLTWTDNTLHMYDANSGKKIDQKIYAGQGWGLTTDGNDLYMSDGSSRITVREAGSFKIKRSISVTAYSRAVEYLNELEWIDGKIWANVYTTNQIVIINPKSGVVEGVVELEGLLPEEDHAPNTDVLNGIAYDAEGERIFVTGKNWNKLFEIEIVAQ